MAMARCTFPTTPRGFTLVEVLIAMSIMAIVAVMAWQGVDGIVRARETTQGHVDQVLRTSTVLAQWEQDLGAIQDTEDTTNVPALVFDGARASMTRRGQNGMQVVVWSRRDNAWFRWISPPTRTIEALRQAWQNGQQLMGNETGQLKTLSGLVDWQVYFFRDNGWTNPQSSGTGTPAATPGTAAGGNTVSQPLPNGVRIVLSFDGSAGLNGTVTRDIVLGPR
jgi:general secretion pathway protein J